MKAFENRKKGKRGKARTKGKREYRLEGKLKGKEINSMNTSERKKKIKEQLVSGEEKYRKRENRHNGRTKKTSLKG